MGLLDSIFGGGPVMPALDEQTAMKMMGPQGKVAAPVQAPRPDFGGGIDGTKVVAALLSGAGGPLGALGNLMLQNGQNDQQVAVKNQTYDWLLKQKDPQTGQPITPEMAKVIVTNKDVASQVLPRLLGTKATVEAATKGAPTGYMWKDPTDPAKGVSVMPGFEPKPDPIEVAIKRDELARNQQQSKADDTRIKGIRAEGDAGRETLSKIQQLREARKGVTYEGGFAPDARTKLGKILPDSPIPGVGLPFVPSQEEAGKAEQVQSLATDIQLQFTGKTKGAISDKEMALFGQATPGMAMSDAGAQSVMDGMEAGALRSREKPKFYEAYRKANGSLDGADDAWDTFVDSKPILEPDANGSFRVNKANVGAWREFVGGNAPQSETPASTGGGGVLDKARAAIANGADRNAVIERLKANGIDPAGL